MALGARIDRDAIVDTGFSEHLTLPASIIESLDLELLDTVRVRLADGSHAPCDLYRVRVDWLDTTMTIAIEGAETDPLVGVRLLKGCNLSIEGWSS